MTLKQKTLKLLTTKRRVGTSFQVHLAVSPLTHFLGIVSNAVAAVLPAAQANALLKAIRAGTLKSVAHMVFVHEGIHKKMNCPLMFTLHDFHEVCVVTKHNIKYNRKAEKYQSNKS